MANRAHGASHAVNYYLQIFGGITVRFFLNIHNKVYKGMSSTKKTLNIDEKIDYCLSMVAQMNKELRQEVLQWFVLNAGRNMVHESSDGSRIIMDNLPEPTVERLYQYIMYKYQT